MLKRLQDAHQEEEEALAMDRKRLSSKETKLEEERRKLLGLGDLGSRVMGTAMVKRKLCHKTESQEGFAV